MKLMTTELEKRFTEVGSQENVKDPVIVAKFFNPTGAGTWYATEYDPKTQTFSAMCQSLATGTTNGATFPYRNWHPSKVV